MTTGDIYSTRNGGDKGQESTGDERVTQMGEVAKEVVGGMHHGMTEAGLRAYEGWLNDPFEQCRGDRLASMVGCVYRAMELERRLGGESGPRSDEEGQ